MRLVCCLLGVVLLSFPMLVDATEWGNPVDQVIKQSGAEVVSDVDGNGAERRRVLLPNDVEITQTRKGDRITTFAVDMSGLGAVHCVWMIYVEVAAGYQSCTQFENAPGVERVETALSRIEAFMAANSYGLMTREALADARLKRIARTRSRSKLAPGERSDCSKGDLLAFVSSIDKQDDRAFFAGVDKVLSVPRFPASAPCL